MLEETIGRIVKASSIYETEAWGLKNQNDFLNQAFIIETHLHWSEVLTECQRIEMLLERNRSIKWGPRTIDIDIIFYDNEVVDKNNITIPHPRMHERNFVLHPLMDIIPEYSHPVLKRTIRELKEKSKDSSYVSL